MGKAFNTSLLSCGHTIVSLTGKFYTTIALNIPSELDPNVHGIVFLFDLHIDVPADIMGSVRGVGTLHIYICTLFVELFRIAKSNQQSTFTPRLGFSRISKATASTKKYVRGQITCDKNLPTVLSNSSKHSWVTI